MPRYELALILKAMRRVSDLPSDRVPARARPAASRPSQPRVPCLRDTGTPRAARGRSREQRGRAWVGRSARPRARGRRVGVCPRVCAVAGGGVPNTQRARGRGGPRTPALRSPMEGLREDTRARTQAGPALRPRVEKLLVVPAGRSSRSPALSVRDQYSLPPKPASAGCVPHALVTVPHQSPPSSNAVFKNHSHRYPRLTH